MPSVAVPAKKRRKRALPKDRHLHAGQLFTSFWPPDGQFGEDHTGFTSSVLTGGGPAGGGEPPLPSAQGQSASLHQSEGRRQRPPRCTPLARASPAFLSLKVKADSTPTHLQGRWQGQPRPVRERKAQRKGKRRLGGEGSS